MGTHKLKTWPQYFEAIISGAKTFEVRKNDREYTQGDTLILREYDPDKQEYTGRQLQMRVTYLLADPTYVLKGTVIMALAPVPPQSYPPQEDDPIRTAEHALGMCTKLQNEMVSHYENNSQPAFEKAEATVQYMLKSKSDLGRAYAQVAMMRDALAFARDILLSETTDPGQHRASVNFLANYITQVTNNNVGAMAAIVLRKAAEYQTTKMQAEASDEGAFDTKTIKAIGELTEAIRAWMQAANEATQGGM